MLLSGLFVFAGVLFTMLEIFIFPGFGITGLMGFISFFGGLGYAAYLIYALKTVSLTYAAFILFSSVIASLIFSWIMTRVLKNSSIGKSMILENTLDNDLGYDASNDELILYYGEQGQALTPLTPSGSVLLKGERMSVISDQGYISKGTEVEVVNVEDNTLYVKAVENSISTPIDQTKKIEKPLVQPASDKNTKEIEA
jgi:membrane-bound serine protease (ClpP class)